MKMTMLVIITMMLTIIMILPMMMVITMIVMTVMVIVVAVRKVVQMSQIVVAPVVVEHLPSLQILRLRIPPLRKNQNQNQNYRHWSCSQPPRWTPAICAGLAAIPQPQPATIRARPTFLQS